MRPSNDELKKCYELVKDVNGQINQNGGFLLENSGQFEDLIHKFENFFYYKFYNEGKIEKHFK